VLELGKAGSAGAEKGVRPVLRDGTVVAWLRASNWREAATAVVGDREWALTKRRGELAGRWATEPEDVSARLSARKASFWKDNWTVTLEGRTVDVQTASMWKSTHRYLVNGRQIAMSGSTGGWSPRPTLDVVAALPLHQQVFLLWLELVLSRRAAAAAAA
jgi:hypothetical protein